jgi:hypothetical protein
MESFARPITPTGQQPMRKERAVHGPSRGTGYGLQNDPLLFEEAIQNTPRECPVRSATLKRQIDQKRGVR